MINCKIFLGKPINFIPTNSQELKPLCKIYPPSIDDITEENNISYIGLLTMSQEEIEDSFAENYKNQNLANIKIPTPFEYLLAVAS
jgi:hypothetical protein